MNDLFNSLGCHRDRALLSFWLTSGVRASELLGLRHGDIDIGRRTITVISKGSRLREPVPASIDSFVWLTLYLGEAPSGTPGQPVWWTRRGPRRPLTYSAARAMLQRANRRLGTNWSLHDLRHTAARRLLADPNFSLVDVQAVLRHAHITTTQLYVQPRLEELVDKVVAHYSAPAQPAASANAAYNPTELDELLGLQR